MKAGYPVSVFQNLQQICNMKFLKSIHQKQKELNLYQYTNIFGNSTYCSWNLAYLKEAIFSMWKSL